MSQKLLTDLPADVLQHIMRHIQLAHHAGLAAPACRVISIAVKSALKLRHFSAKVVTLAGHASVHAAARTVTPARLGRRSAGGARQRLRRARWQMRSS